MGFRRSLVIAALSVIITLLAASSAVADSRAQSFPNLVSNTCRTLSTEGMGTGVWQVTGTFTATVTWYVSADGTNFLPIDAATADAPGTAVNSTANTAGAWSAAVAGYRQMQACITGYASGAVNLYLSAVDTGGGGGGGATGEVMVEIVGFATEAKQDTQITALANIETATEAVAALISGGAIPVSGNFTSDGLTDTELRATPVVVTGVVTATNLDVQIGGSDTVTVTATNLDVQSAGLDLLPALAQGAATSGQVGALIMGAVTTAAPSYTSGQTSPLSLTTAGNARIECVAGCGGSGGTSQTDDTVLGDLTAGGALFDTTPPTITDGRIGAFRMSTDRYLYTIFPSAQAVSASNLDVQSGGADLLTETTGAAILTSTNFAAAFGPAGTPDTQVASVQGITGMTPIATNLTQVLGSALSATNPVFTCLVSNGASECITIPDAITVDLDTVDTQPVEGFALLTEGSGGAVAVGPNNPLTVDLGVNNDVHGTVAHDSADSGNPLKIGGYASATIPTAVTAADRVNAWYTLSGAAVIAANDPCQRGTKLYLSLSQATSTELFTGTASSRTFICDVAIVQKASSTQTWSLISGTGTVCATSSSAMIGGTTAANGTDLSLQKGNGGYTVLKTDTDADNVCLLQSSTDRINGSLTYVVAANQ